KRGRDHNPFGFTMWLAGGAVKGGTIYGATDDFGFKAIEKPVHVHDIHATILYLFGIEHTKLTYRYSGRDFRLTDVAGNVLHDLLAYRGPPGPQAGQEARVTAPAQTGPAPLPMGRPAATPGHCLRHSSGMRCPYRLGSRCGNRRSATCGRPR